MSPKKPRLEAIISGDIVNKINEVLIKGEPNNISEDTVSGYTGYAPQSVIDAVNSVLKLEEWGFEELSSDVVTGSKDGVALETVIETKIKVWIGSVDNFRVAWGQGRITRGDRGDARKSAQTDALKKALSYFSIGNRAYLGLLDAKRPAVVEKVVTQETPVKPTPVAQTTVSNKVTVPQQAKIRAMYMQKGLNTDAMKLLLKKRFDIDSHAQLTVAQASEWIEYLTKMEDPMDTLNLDDLNSAL